jgi:hypothetical protein
MTYSLSRITGAPFGCQTPATVPQGPSQFHIFSPSPTSLSTCSAHMGPAITPLDVLLIVDNFILSILHPPGPQWDCVWKWCLVAGQSGANRKSKIFLETNPVTINDEDFDRWVGCCLDISLGPCPVGSPHALAGLVGNLAMDYLALSKMSATTIGTNMMQFSQAVAPQGRAMGLTGNKTALSTGKGFNQDQIAKPKDACGIHKAQQIPPIWSVIQTSKGKSFNTYRAHLAKSVDAWCHLHHINRYKSIFLEAKFFEDLVALQFNPGGSVVQFQSVAWGLNGRWQQKLNIVKTMRKRLPAPPTHTAFRTSSSKIVGRRLHQLETTWTSS